jgi:hypothetical protein
MKSLPSFSVLLAVCLAASVLSAGAAEVRVYTNADLAELPPIETGQPVEGGDGELGWEFVHDFIDREHRRLDAEREWELERRAADTERDREARYRAGSSWGYYGVYPYHPTYGRPDHGKRPGNRGPGIGVDAPIRPLHAGPTLAERQRARAIQNAPGTIRPQPR